jgi:hypothetical protein
MDFTVLKTSQRCILIGLLASVGVPVRDVCVRNGTSNGIQWRRKKKRRESAQFKWFARIANTASDDISTLACLFVVFDWVWERDREKKWNIDSFRLLRLREKSFELYQTQEASLSLVLLLLNSIEREKR